MIEAIPADRKLRVAVLMGGSSSERPISLSTGAMIRSALDPARYEVTAIDTRDVLALCATSAETAEVETAGDAPASGGASALASPASEPASIQPVMPPMNRSVRPDVVFIALHGKGGEDGSVQGMLELMGVPYTGSGILASALAMDKQMAKRLFRAAGIPVIDDVQVRRDRVPQAAELIDEVTRLLGFPVFVKPNAEGSTFGCALVEDGTALPEAVATALKYDAVALIERYVRGMEITVGVLGNADDSPYTLPIIEIVPKAAFYDYESKYASGGSDHIIPARLTEPLRRRAEELALQCHTLLGCRGMSRTDMIVRDGEICVLEVNTIPGMTPTSLLPQAAAAAGISFSDLLNTLIGSALSREAQSGGSHAK